MAPSPDCCIHEYPLDKVGQRFQYDRMINAEEALERLREGNRRYVQDIRDNGQVGSLASRRIQLLDGQEPHTTILGCSDSRVPMEMIFDQGLGDIFSIRVAGNIVAPSQIGSVEFAAEQFGTRLLVILGHTQCGAIKATLDELKNPSKDGSPNLKSIVGRIMPTVAGLVEDAENEPSPERLFTQAVRANVRASANQMRHGSTILENLHSQGKLLVVGAEYSLETGEVDFFHGLPGS